jgi:NAD(P)-dependent dehydrogenase (short-subunit alcohol dehydrogenase family)
MPTLLVFGARNLGKAVAGHFAGEGWSTAAVARTRATIDGLGIEGALGIVADAAQADEVERAFAETRERFGSVDLVVNAISIGVPGGPLAEVSTDALTPYLGNLIPGVFNILRVGARALGEQGSGTIVQITGGSARRGMAGRGPWAAAAFATRALVQSAAQELRQRGVHTALLIVDATIQNAKNPDADPERSTSEEDVVQAVAYLAAQSPRGWTHELQITPRGDRWTP